MSNSYKFYSDTKDVMKKYVNATEGAIIYGISKSRMIMSRIFLLSWTEPENGHSHQLMILHFPIILPTNGYAHIR